VTESPKCGHGAIGHTHTHTQNENQSVYKRDVCDIRKRALCLRTVKNKPCYI
jgi:hypothetical protein